MYLTQFSRNLSSLYSHSKYFYLLDDEDRSGVYPSNRRFGGGSIFLCICGRVHIYVHMTPPKGPGLTVP